MSLKERVGWAAKRAASASPVLGSQGGLIRETALRMQPSKFLQTAAWAENESLIAVSKLILRVPAGGGGTISPPKLHVFQCHLFFFVLERGRASVEIFMQGFIPVKPK